MRVPSRIVEQSVATVRSSAGSKRTAPIDVAIRERASAFGIELLWKPTRVLGLAALGLAATATRVLGAAGVVVATSIATGLWIGTGVLAKTRSERLVLLALPETALRLSEAIRAGYPIGRAIADVVQSATPSVELRVASRQIADGRPVLEAIGEWSQEARSDAECLLAGAVLLGIGGGGDLASALDLIGDGLRDDIELSARRRALVAQATMSAGVLVVLPILFAVSSSFVRDSAMFTGFTSVAAAAMGIGLDLVGIMWMRRLLRSLR